ncbi:S8 family serine peptidase [Paenibacillus sp. Marseille-Q4541]|uniref:S8 family serine peptidase n=1 Tax=Paenibacillus sp. Marseille-Q4541 TaxID=2831522 RepID=UPI001BA96298|nr:S8 family serine peptidase [Paenibacillus sp. Marseille-Q4541]
MVIEKKMKKSFSLGMAFFLALSIVSPVGAAPTIGSTSGKMDLRSTSPELITAKVDTKLNKLFQDDEYVTYLVKLSEQVDTTVAAQKAMKLATMQKATPAAAKLSVRTSVVNSLRETASRTQIPIQKYLDDQKKSGQVKDYKSFFIVNSLAVTSTKEVMEGLALQPGIEKILPNEERFLQDVTVDETATSPKESTKALDNPAATKESTTSDVDPESIEWNIEQVNAPEVWEQGIDGTGIVVANLDTGVEYTHPALASKWRGLDASGNIVDPELSWYDPHSGSSLPADTDGHGTHTMGTMVGAEEDGTNHIGVAPGAKWIAVRIFNPSTTDAIILDAGQWLLAPVDEDGNLHPELAPDVVNNSWGGGAGIDEWFRPIVQAWRDAQIFPEFSAGNTTLTNPGGPGSVANPANYPESFATGATDINGNLASFSLLGPSPYGEIKPEVSAPGVNIRSSVPGGQYEGGWNGTSMAGPHTTAIAALLLQANSSLTVDDLEDILTDTATERTDSQYPTSPNNGYGHGIVNALDAVGSVLQGVGTVAGRVTTGGDDLIDPVLEHTPITSLYSGLDSAITMNVSDNVSVTAVEVFARIKGSSRYVYIPADRITGDAKEGTYQAIIPASLIEHPGLEYYIRVNDYGNNGFDTPVYAVAVSEGIEPGYSQDFETDSNGFLPDGENPWVWGAPVSGPGSAFSGEKVIATNLTGTYAANASTALIAPPINLQNSPEGALLSFKQWYDLESTRDIGSLYIATEESDYEFEPLTSFTGSSDGWKTQYVDLTAYAGQKVYLAFLLTSDGSVQKQGWYLDDFSLQLPDEEAPSAPTAVTADVSILGDVTLNWTAPEDEDLKEYQIYRSETAGAGYEAIGTTTRTTYVDNTTEGNTTYYYVVKAKDYSGNESEASEEVSVEVQVPESIYSDSFDGTTDNGWTHSGTGDEWERGVSVSPGPTVPVTEPNVWGTDLDSTYENSANFSLVSPVIDLTNAENAALTFNQWYEIETNYDVGYVEITSNGGTTWTELGKFSNSTNGKQWSPVFYDVSSYIGSEVQVRFRLKSDSSVVKTGWYLDDFRILAVEAPGSTKSDVVSKAALKKQKAIEKAPVLKQFKTDQIGETKEESAIPSGDAGTFSLPAAATVTVLETGRSARTDVFTGRYNFKHVAGDYNLKAEAYGYYSKTVPVTVTDGATKSVNFKLDAIPKGTVTGTVTNERTGEPIADAVVVVLEDAQVAPVRTGEDGTFTLSVYEGSYTLSISAQNYYGETKTVEVPANESITEEISLKPFIGYPGEIKYDDGTPENARAFNAAGNAWAVRMTPESDVAQVTGASFRFWNTEWPIPGGTAFQYSVYDASGPQGAPGRELAGPFDGTALRNDEWTTVEFEEPITVQGDFYIVYIQTPAGTSAPGLATDESSTNAERSWQRASGAWSPSPVDEGNYMIRAIVRYPINAPIITTPLTDTFTNEDTITVKGTSPANGSTLKVYNGEEIAGEATIEDGKFELNIDLSVGENVLTAEAIIGGDITDRSAPVTVTLDKTAPVLTVTSPEDGEKTNAEAYTVRGSVYDDYLSTVTVNGQSVTVGEDGSFTHRILINEGENTINVTAKDRANNETTITRQVIVGWSLPVVTNLTPASDVYITGGESIDVSFDSAPGLSASFRIELPIGPNRTGSNEIPLTETSEGHYVGTYTTSSSLRLDGGVIVVRVWDAAGNETEISALGKLYVTNDGEEPAPPNIDPIAVIQAPNAAQRNREVTFDGTASSDEDGTIVSYSWNFGEGATGSGPSAKHVFTKAGNFTVELTVTDDRGGTNMATFVIRVR